MASAERPNSEPAIAPTTSSGANSPPGTPGAYDRQAAAAGGERRDHRPELEAAQELLEHEDRGGEPRAGAEQDSGVRGAESEAAREEVTERRAHLHRRTLPAERETGADRQRAADELDRKDRSAYRARRARRRFATSAPASAVQPVWCDAPSPSPVSPSKYS